MVVPQIFQRRKVWCWIGSFYVWRISCLWIQCDHAVVRIKLFRRLDNMFDFFPFGIGSCLFSSGLQNVSNFKDCFWNEAVFRQTSRHSCISFPSIIYLASICIFILLLFKGILYYAIFELMIKNLKIRWKGIVMTNHREHALHRNIYVCASFVCSFRDF